MYNGIIVINKEPGFTSFDVVAKLRGICGQRKIGHTGTLDPDATGVLPVCLGNATKVCDMLTDSDKEYEAVLLLGTTTDTQDCSGTVLQEREVTADDETVRRCILSFTGKQDQIPPMYSALKVNGQKLCDLARAGKTVERRPRPVEIYKIEILEIQLPRVKMRVACSKGTYIRTLCNDIGEKLGCGGCMEKLRRIRAAGFTEKEAHSLAEVQAAADSAALDQMILKTDTVFADLPAASTDEKFDVILKNGNRLRPEFFQGEEPHLCEGTDRIRVYDHSGKFCAVYRFDAESRDFRPVKMFLE